MVVKKPWSFQDVRTLMPEDNGKAGEEAGGNDADGDVVCINC